MKRSQLNLSKVAKMAKKATSSKNGISRAAKFLIVLGTEQSAEILKQLEPHEVEILMKEIAGIEQIDAEEKGELLAEFKELVTKEGAFLRGGIDQAKKFLEASMDSKASEAILRRVNHRDLYADFAFLEGVEAQILASVLSNEHKQIVAVALSYLKPKIAAEVMRYLPKNIRTEVAIRIAKAAKIHPEAIHRVARMLREKFERKDQESYSEVGGAESLAQILNYLGREQESDILNSIGQETPDTVQKVKEHLYTFEELLVLSHREMRLLISRLGDDGILATALRGLHQDLRLHFFNSISQNRAADLLDQIENSSPVHVKEIYEARSYVLSIARDMDEDGTICIKKDGEEYV